MGIIVLGVLTALLAEQAVQSIDWRHKVEAAIGDMAQELGNADGPEFMLVSPCTTVSPLGS